MSKYKIFVEDDVLVVRKVDVYPAYEYYFAVDEGVEGTMKELRNLLLSAGAFAVEIGVDEEED